MQKKLSLGGTTAFHWGSTLKGHLCMLFTTKNISSLQFDLL